MPIYDRLSIFNGANAIVLTGCVGVGIQILQVFQHAPQALPWCNEYQVSSKEKLEAIFIALSIFSFTKESMK